MATNTSKVFIDIITQFTGTKSIKQADDAFTKLAKSIGRVVSVAAIEEFSRASIKAFLADDAAAKQLEKTLSNLGIYFDSGVLSNYIQGLQDTTGVLDDQLRPAFASLAVATGDYTKAQDLLTTALDVSQGTGKSLNAVTTALSKAYLGNFAAVSRLGAGISKAEIKAGDFNAIQDKLNKNFGGSALAAASTYAGKIKILNAALTDVKETIGKGFVDAFVTLTGPNGSATEFAASMKSAALDIADILRGVGVIASKFEIINTANGAVKGGIFSSWLMAIPVAGSYLEILKNIGKEQRLTAESFFPVAPEPAQIGYAKAAADKKALEIAKKTAAEEKKKADAAKAAAKAAADKLKTEKANAVLNLAGKVLDVQQAQILAALGKDITQADKDRLLLQQALLNDNAEAAVKLSQKIISTQLQAIALGAMNPLSGWNTNIADVIASLVNLQTELAKVSGTALTAGQLLAADFAAVVVDMNDPSFAAADAETKAALAGLAALGKGSVGNTAISPSYVDDALLRNATTGAYNNNMQTINLVVDGQILTSVVTNGQQNTSASGVSPAVSRLNPYSSGF
jgi:hypothetical protein